MLNSDLPLCADKNSKASDGEKMRLDVAEIKTDERSVNFTATLPCMLYQREHISSHQRPVHQARQEIQ